MIGDLTGLCRLSGARSRSSPAENPTGAPGGGALATDGFGAHAARDLGTGWKVGPAVTISAGTTFALEETDTR